MLSRCGASVSSPNCSAMIVPTRLTRYGKKSPRSSLAGCFTNRAIRKPSYLKIRELTTDACSIIVNATVIPGGEKNRSLSPASQEGTMDFGYFTLSDNHYENNTRSSNQFIADITAEALYAEKLGMHSAWIG